MTTARDLDIVLFGATGFAGGLTAGHLAAHAPDGVRIGLAGRDPSRLADVRDGIGPRAAGWELLRADSSDEACLRTMAERTRVVVSTVGPYARHGLPLVLACAEAGTDYVDLAGEALFVRRSIDTARALAGRTGARIIHSCGFDSVPSDLAVLLLAERVERDGAGTLGETTLYAAMRGGLSGGTLASMRGQLAEAARSEEARAITSDPYSLSPDHAAEPEFRHARWSRVKKVDARGEWVAPFVMAAYNTRVVRRSNALAGYRYGRDFRYGEAMVTGPGPLGAARALGVTGMLAGMAAAFSTPALDPLVDRVLPKPGTGPSEESRARGGFHLEARTETTSGARYRSVVSATVDPGYDGTAIMLGESALALALDRDRCPMPAGLTGGVLTPATGLGDVLVGRLAAQGFRLGTARV